MIRVSWEPVMTSSLRKDRFQTWNSCWISLTGRFIFSAWAWRQTLCGRRLLDSCGGDISSVLVRGGAGSFQRDVLHESLRTQSRFAMSSCAAFSSVSSQQAHGAAQTGHGCRRLHRSSYFCSGMFPWDPWLKRDFVPWDCTIFSKEKWGLFFFNSHRRPWRPRGQKPQDIWCKCGRCTMNFTKRFVRLEYLVLIWLWLYPLDAALVKVLGTVPH